MICLLHERSEELDQEKYYNITTYFGAQYFTVYIVKGLFTQGSSYCVTNNIA